MSACDVPDWWGSLVAENRILHQRADELAREIERTRIETESYLESLPDIPPRRQSNTVRLDEMLTQ